MNLAPHEVKIALNNDTKIRAKFSFWKNWRTTLFSIRCQCKIDGVLLINFIWMSKNCLTASWIFSMRNTVRRGSSYMIRDWISCNTSFSTTFVFPRFFLPIWGSSSVSFESWCVTFSQTPPKSHLIYVCAQFLVCHHKFTNWRGK